MQGGPNPPITTNLLLESPYTYTISFVGCKDLQYTTHILYQIRSKFIDPESPEKEATLWIQMTGIGRSPLDMHLYSEGWEGSDFWTKASTSFARV